ncbi:hypothetical protein OHO83_17525 [Streptomyces sp. NBC_00569]|uniref:hypothetical protein n=1 Tax=unclassified Streptomyces TaxID=2593676 RepID=UPI00225C3F72|nr:MULTISPECIES: hypothetical protein [unclassified Streptomyces]MCX5439591.1 hypothetical protein [Streptomyces sp. NBC_00063]WUB93963.1 hypothetical protein OHO83_17525 [Streptomyces sp. NBC_00569]
MASAPIVVHALLGTGGRRVAARGQILGLAHSDRDVVEFLRRAGLEDAESLLDDPMWVTWRGGRAHHYEAA